MQACALHRAKALYDAHLRAEEGVPFEAMLARFLRGEDGRVLIAMDDAVILAQDLGEAWQIYLITTQRAGRQWMRWFMQVAPMPRPFLEFRRIKDRTPRVHRWRWEDFRNALGYY